MEEDLFALFEDLKNSGPRGNNRVKQVSKTRIHLNVSLSEFNFIVTVFQGDGTSVGNNSSRDDDLSLLSSSSIQRTDLDFTDMLWSVLHRVESYRDRVTRLNLMKKCIAMFKA